VAFLSFQGYVLDDEQRIGDVPISDGSELMVLLRGTVGCIVAGTLVTTASGGTRAIESIASGELITSYDLGSKSTRVSEVIKNDSCLASEILSINDGLIQVTGEQPVYSSKGWLPARFLKTEDLLFKPGEQTWIRVDKLEWKKGEFTVFNLRAAPLDNYLANNVLLDVKAPLDEAVYTPATASPERLRRLPYGARNIIIRPKIVESAFFREVAAQVNLPARMKPKRIYSIQFTIRGQKLPTETRIVNGKLIETKPMEIFEVPSPAIPPTLRVKATSPDGAFAVNPNEVKLAAPPPRGSVHAKFYVTPILSSGIHKILFTVFQRSAQLVQLNADIEIRETLPEQESTVTFSSPNVSLLEIPGINKRYAIRATYIGGMGLVHKIEDLDAPGKYMVAKTYFEKLPTESQSVNVFHREAMNWLGLASHPNIVQAFLIAQIGTKPYIFCEFIDGENLRSILVRVTELPMDQILSIVTQICDALHHAHTNGLVHRDIKPENILIRKDGVVKLTDFGVAKAIPDGVLTQSADLKGTIPYMAPELFTSGAEWDQRVDIYSLGIVLYEMLTGKRPLECEDLPTKLSKKAISYLPSNLRPDTPKRFDFIVGKCLAPEASERYFDATEISRALSGEDERHELVQQKIRWEEVMRTSESIQGLAPEQRRAYIDEAKRRILEIENRLAHLD
jgi:hypothetical protein